MYLFSLVLGRKELITKAKIVYFIVCKVLSQILMPFSLRRDNRDILLLMFTDKEINSEFGFQGWSY